MATTKRERTERRILADFTDTIGGHDNPQYVYEHGRTFVICNACGASWSVANTVDNDYIFEDLDYGDESCHH